MDISFFEGSKTQSFAHNVYERKWKKKKRGSVSTSVRRAVLWIKKFPSLHFGLGWGELFLDYTRRILYYICSDKFRLQSEMLQIFRNGRPISIKCSRKAKKKTFYLRIIYNKKITGFRFSYNNYAITVPNRFYLVFKYSIFAIFITIFDKYKGRFTNRRQVPLSIGGEQKMFLNTMDFVPSFDCHCVIFEMLSVVIFCVLQ